MYVNVKVFGSLGYDGFFLINFFVFRFGDVIVLYFEFMIIDNYYF